MYWDRQNFGDHPTEDELVAHFVIPFLRALGWPPERIAVKWRCIDVAVFTALPRTPENCRFVIEAKRLGAGVESALEQARGYVESLGVPRDIIVTDGIRYRMYSRENGFRTGRLCESDSVETVRNRSVRPDEKAIEETRSMEPWYKIATPRKEVREGRSFNPDEFAIHLEQVIAGTAPEDYREPEQFFARTCFTRALREHAGMVLRRLSGETANTAPVMTLITQFGGGKTHTLTALYHLVTNGAKAAEYSGVANLISEAGIKTVPEARVAVFVGNAWDPQEGRETPWIDVARQLAGENGVKELGAAAKTTPPGTEALGRVFKAAGGPVLLLFDEVLNFMNRHRGMAEQFHAFIQNLTVATTGTTQGAAIISLPRSQVEMTDWDMQWQDKITKVVRRVAKDLIANDETEISEVVRRRLFEDIGSDRIRKSVSQERMRTGASSGGRNCRRNGRRWTAPRRRPRPGNICADAFRGLLSVPSGYAFGVPAEMAGPSAIPADARDARHAGPVDFLGLPHGVHRGSPRAAHHPRVRAAGGAGVPERGARAARRIAPHGRHRLRHLRSSSPTPGRWTRTPRAPCGTSTAAWRRRSSSSLRAGR